MVNKSISLSYCQYNVGDMVGTVFGRGIVVGDLGIREFGKGLHEQRLKILLDDGTVEELYGFEISLVAKITKANE